MKPEFRLNLTDPGSCYSFCEHTGLFALKAPVAPPLVRVTPHPPWTLSLPPYKTTPVSVFWSRYFRIKSRGALSNFFRVSWSLASPCSGSSLFSNIVEIMLPPIVKTTEMEVTLINRPMFIYSTVLPLIFNQTGPRPENRLPDNISNTTKAVAVDLVNTFESRYTEGYKSLVTDALHVHNSTTSNSATTTSSSSDEGELDPSPSYSVSCAREELQGYPLPFMNARGRYIRILHSLFVQQINWGRIVAMLSFLRALCEVLDASPQSQASSSEDENEVNSPLPPSSSSPSDKTDFVPLATQSADGSADGDEDKKLTTKVQDRRIASLHYIVWTMEFIYKESKLGDWIEEHGSWVS
ncbi:unnamed protein product [Taenia asiatica]|uniref:BCL domain-containing protein n=1 Tax=Taenia asiatica TaxID=60517 RepID=A0A0R3WA51_TAEAS|nr:unnamed protein product [Taenia asiatica]